MQICWYFYHFLTEYNVIIEGNCINNVIILTFLPIYFIISLLNIPWISINNELLINGWLSRLCNLKLFQCLLLILPTFIEEQSIEYTQFSTIWELLKSIHEHPIQFLNESPNHFRHLYWYYTNTYQYHIVPSWISYPYWSLRDNHHSHMFPYASQCTLPTTYMNSCPFPDSVWVGVHI